MDNIPQMECDELSLRDILSACTALQSNPRIFKTVCAFWGFPEFFEVVDKLQIVEGDRGIRNGFPYEIHQELTLLCQIFMDNIEEVADPSLTPAQIKTIKEIVFNRKNIGSFRCA